jgi:hypothetical protein
MLKLDNVKMALENAAKEIVRQAKINLGATQTIIQNDGKAKRKHIDASGNLRNSLKYSDIKNKDGKLSIEILMDFYGDFIDKGVDGTIHKTPKQSPYSFKRDTVGAAMQYSIFQWMRTKRIRLRDLGTGQFKKGKITSKSYESLAYVIARSIKRKGINQTYFLTTPFNLTTSQLPDVLEKALGADIEAYLLSLNQVK